MTGSESDYAARQRDRAIARHLPTGHVKARRDATQEAQDRPRCETCGEPLDPVLAEAGRHLLCRPPRRRQDSS